MSVKNIFVDMDRGEPVIGKSDNSIAPLPLFVQGDSLLLRIWLLTGYSRFNPYTYVAVDGITLQVALGKKIGNTTEYYTQQFTWEASENLALPYWEAVLPMNTDALTDHIGANPSAQAWFEIKIIQDLVPVTVLSKLVTVQAAVIKEGGTVVPENQNVLSVEAANSAFVKTVHTGSFDLMNANGKGIRVYVDEDGAFRTDPIA